MPSPRDMLGQPTGDDNTTTTLASVYKDKDCSDKLAQLGNAGITKPKHTYTYRNGSCILLYYYARRQASAVLCIILYFIVARLARKVNIYCVP